jgi:tape measure domain-containing protein
LDAQKNVQKLISQFNGLARIAQFALAAIGVGKLTDSIDEYITLENKLKAVTSSTEEFLSAQKGVERIADEVAVPVSDVADSFLRYQLATESLGRSQEEVLDFTKRVTQAMILSGASAQEAHRAAVQLAQGFGKDFKAAAQDLKSVKEQAPVLARIIEKAAGGIPGTLLAMAKAGKINSKLVFDAVREAGDELDKDFAKRQKTFGNLADLLGNTWLQLIKRLKPYFVPIIDALEKVVLWIREWVKDGSAMNSVVAGLIVALGALTYVFGGLAVSVAAAAAPFIGLFLILEDLVGFLRGDESLLGDFLEAAFGAEKIGKVRDGINELIGLVGKLFAALAGDSQELEMAAWRFKRAMMNAIDEVWAYAKEKFAQSFFGQEKAAGPQAKPIDPVTGKPQNESDVLAWIADVTGFKDEIYAARRNAGIDPETGAPLAGTTGPSTAPAWAPIEPTAPTSFRSPYGNQNMTPVEINNNITVQGNADAPVARDIATQTGRATADVFGGRDRSAIGAGFGVASP